MNTQTELFNKPVEVKQKNRSILNRKKPPNGFIKETDEPGTYTANKASEDQIIEKAFEIIAKRFERSEPLTSPDLTKQFLRMHFARQEHESFVAIWLDNQHKVIDVDELFVGTIDGASVYPREVCKTALAKNAAAVIFSHNHPSGLAEPSEADKFITRHLKEALKMLDIRVLDHVIIGGMDSYSFAEKGLI